MDTENKRLGRIIRTARLLRHPSFNYSISTMDVDIKLSRSNGQPWGMRLSGGVDFSFPLTVVRVALGGLADQAGVHAGDLIFKINGETIHHLRHCEVHDRLVKAGNEFTLTVLRNLKTKRE
ncbi:PDZ and LIM domain protein 7 [Andrena cerasifolii]|uniref:PDZ and LIM domain protein 7 n=1 Tax=Andrena cerasifolii TaxID=2819439 RepID=UPI0040376781